MKLQKLKSNIDSEAARITTNEILQFWVMARLPTRRDDGIVRKILELNENWKSIRKNRNKKSSFVETLDDLFDVAHAYVMDLNDVPQEAKNFLILQRRKG